MAGYVRNQFTSQRASVDKGQANSGRSRGSGAKPYPVPWSIEPEQAPKFEGMKLRHLSDLDEGEFERFVDRYPEGYEVFEKVDGAVALTCGHDELGIWTAKKSGPKRRSIAEYSGPHDEAAREAHHYVMEVQSYLQQALPKGCFFSADVLYGPRPNTIRYDRTGYTGNLIVVHEVYDPMGRRLARETYERFFNQWIPTVTGPRSWGIHMRRELRVEEFASTLVLEGPMDRNLFESAVTAELARIPSAYGAEYIEGLVLRDRETGELLKVVDKEVFTKRNSEFWEFRDLLGKGRKIEGAWRKGIRAKFREAYAERVLGTRSILGPKPKFERVVLNRGKAVSELLAITAEAAREVNALHEGMRSDLPEEIEARNLAELRETSLWLHDMTELAEAIHDGEPLQTLVAVFAEGLTYDRSKKKDLEEFIAKHFSPIVRKLNSSDQGWHSDVFLLQDGKVLKVTNEEDGADSAFRLKGKSLPGIARVFDVGKMPVRFQSGEPIYYVLLERVEPLDESSQDELSDASTGLYYLFRPEKPPYGTVTWDEFKEGAFEMADAKSDRETVAQWLATMEKFDVPKIAETLAKNRVYAVYDWNGGNIMKRGSEHVLVDFGSGKTSQVQHKQIGEARETDAYEHYSSRPDKPEVAQDTQHFGSAGSPRGVYAYQRDAKFKPYATDRKHKFLLKPTKPVTYTSEYSKSDLERDLAKLVTLGVDVPLIIKRWEKYKKNFRAHELPFSLLWYVVCRAERDPDPEVPPSWSAPSVSDARYARELLVSLGHRVIDDRDGIIWSSEPEQAVFLTNDSFEIVGSEIYEAKPRPGALEAKARPTKANVQQITAAFKAWIGSAEHPETEQAAEEAFLRVVAGTPAEPWVEKIIEISARWPADGLPIGQDYDDIEDAHDHLYAELHRMGVKHPAISQWKKYSGITEDKGGQAASIGLTVGRFQPFHKDHARLIRKMAQRYDKVIIAVTGNKVSAENPFPFELRRELMELSLPDVEPKLEVYQVDKGYLPSILEHVASSGKSSYKPGMALEVVVGEDRVEEFKSQVERAVQNLESGVDMSAVRVLKAPDGREGSVSGKDIRAALASGDVESVKKMLDPHVLSDEGRLDELIEKMRAVVGGGQVEETLEDPGKLTWLSDGESDAPGSRTDVARKAVAENEDKLKRRLKASPTQELGYGEMGVAFLLSNGKVLKSTTDDAEADASFAVMHHQGEHLAKIIDVFKFPESGSRQCFGIVQERLQPLLSHNKHMLKKVWDAKQFEDIVEELPRLTEQGEISDEILSYVRKLGLDVMGQELKAAGIQWFSDWHWGNVMQRGKTVVLIDFGVSEVGKQDIGMLESVIREFLTDIASTEEEGAQKLKELVIEHRLLLKKRGIDVSGAKFLGHGRNGSAWRLKNDKVLKVTTDDAEAEVANHIRGKKLERVYRIDDVFAFPGKYGDGGHIIYGIVQEGGLEKPSEQERDEFDRTVEALMSTYGGSWETDALSTENFGGAIEALVADKERKTAEKREVLESIKKFGLHEMVKELKKLGISFADFHSGNFLKRGDTFVVVDLGTGGEDQHDSRPSLVGVDESLVKEDEPVTKTTALGNKLNVQLIGGEQGVDVIIQNNRQKLAAIGVNPGAKLGAGTMGVAYDCGGDKILKITVDKSEASSNFVLRGRQLKHVNQIERVFKFAKTNEQAEARGLEVFGIVGDKLTELSEQEKTEIDYLSDLLTDDDVISTFATKDWEEVRNALYRKISKKHDPEGGGESPSWKTTRKVAGTGAFNRQWNSILKMLQKYQVPETVDELRSNGVQFADYHSGNVMKRGGDYVITDLSMSKTPGGSPDKIDILEVGIGGIGQMAVKAPGTSAWSSGMMARVGTDDTEERDRALGWAARKKSSRKDGRSRG